MKVVGGILATLVLLVSTSSALAKPERRVKRERGPRWETNANFNSRFESVVADVPDWARRGFLKTNVLARKADFSFNFEGFAEYDVAQISLEPAGAPDVRKSRSTVALQELYLDAKWSSVFFRVGRQPVRWSQSWTIPSLDVFTGRRWNRLFVDPVPEQLTHPDGILVSYAGALVEADLFHAVLPAENVFPQPLPDVPRVIRDQTGARVKVRLGGFDFAVVGWRSPEDDLIGGSVSYAFETVVLKAEGGARRQDAGFGILGLDYFGNFGDFEVTAGPQVTWYKEPAITAKKVETILYLPLRFAYKKTSLETQVYSIAETRDSFSSVMLTHELADYKRASLKGSIFAQSYTGQAGRLFSLYETLTGGSLGGLRIDINYAL